MHLHFCSSQLATRGCLAPVCTSLWVCLSTLHTYNEEASTNHYCLDPHIKIHRDLDPKVGGVGKDVVDKSRPILGNFANRCHLIESFYLHKEKTGADINVNKSSAHWWHLHRINDCVLTCRVCFSCQVLLLFLLLQCSISVKFPFTSGTQEGVSSLETSASLELGGSNLESLCQFYLSLTDSWGFFLLSYFLYSPSPTAVDHCPLREQACSQLCSHLHFSHSILKCQTIPTGVFWFG